MKKILVGLGILSMLTTASFAKEVIAKIQSNGYTYEVCIGYGNGVYITYAGSTDTKYVKGDGSGCEFKKYGKCTSKADMLAEIRYKLANKEY